MLISGTSGNKIVSASNKLEKVLRQSTLFSQDSVNIIVDNEQEDLGEIDSYNDMSPSTQRADGSMLRCMV